MLSIDNKEVIIDKQIKTGDDCVSNFDVSADTGYKLSGITQIQNSNWKRNFQPCEICALEKAKKVIVSKIFNKN